MAYLGTTIMTWVRFLKETQGNTSMQSALKTRIVSQCGGKRQWRFRINHFILSADVPCVMVFQDACDGVLWRLLALKGHV